MRIDAEVCDMLAEYAPVYLNTHFNHAAEISPQAGRALALLANAGIPLGNQTVLLRGVNDRPEIIEELCRALLRHRVKPYYLFQCDLVRGIEHFRTPLQTGLDIMSYLRGRLSGLGIPHFCVDTPHAGKIELLPNAILERREDCYVLLDSNGEPFRYPEIAK
jgi:lysine 2,3-aminomutase